MSPEKAEAMELLRRAIAEKCAEINVLAMSHALPLPNVTVIARNPDDAGMYVVVSNEGTPGNLRAACQLALDNPVDAAPDLPPQTKRPPLDAAELGSLDELLRWVRNALERTQFVFNNERDLQEQVERVFGNASESFEREFILTRRDRPDFFFRRLGLVVEVKVEGSLTEHMRQMKRYADHPDVRYVMLVSSKRYPELPSTLSGKPVCNVSLWRSGL